MRKTISRVCALVVLSGLAPATFAGVKVYEKGDKYVELGGRIQIQYMHEDPDSGESTDDLFFRRLRPYIAGSVTENWQGKFQFELGKATDGNEVAVKDAYMRYTGFDNLKITLGNQKPAFSREFLISSTKQQFVERTFTGDHNFATPDRGILVRLDGLTESTRIGWGFSFGSAAHDPDNSKLDFDTPANRNDDFNEGWMTAARIDFHPKGELKLSQGDFARDELKYTISLAAFTWSNDDDNNTYVDADNMSIDSAKTDLDSATGYELSGGLRTNGFSVDAEYQMVEGDSVDGSFTGGIYSEGETELDKMGLEAGYIFPSKKFEVVAGYDSFDADVYAETWNRQSFGLNYFWNKHKVKAQLSYRMNENVDGVDGADADEGFLQFQYLF